MDDIIDIVCCIPVFLRERESGIGAGKGRDRIYGTFYIVVQES